MADSTKQTPADGRESLGTEIFHRLQLVLKESSDDETLSIDTKAADALKRLEQTGRSHLAVMNGDAVVGLFSYRSFALGAVALAEVKAPELPATHSVEHFLEEAAFRRGEERIDDIFPLMKEVGAVIVGNSRALDGVATVHDIMDHLFRFAQPFVLLTEVEHALRALIRHATTDAELATFARAVLRQRSAADPPMRVEDMTFGQYQQVILAEAHFPKFQSTFGGTRATVQSKLEPVRRIRNDIMHFKRVIGRIDYTTLKNTRNWLSRRLGLCSGGANG